MNLYMEVWPSVIPRLFYPRSAQDPFNRENLEGRLCAAERPGCWVC